MINNQPEVGDLASKWVKEYGSVWRLNGCMGVSASEILAPDTSLIIVIYCANTAAWSTVYVRRKSV